MSFGQAIVRVFSNYANFQGRARRSEYWYFVLFYGIVMLCLSLLALIPGAVLLTVIFWLGTVVPNLAVSWRRLHDTGRSGAWVFLSLVPLVGVLILICGWRRTASPGPIPSARTPKAPRPRQRAMKAETSRRGPPCRCSASTGPCRGRPFPWGPRACGLAGTQPVRCGSPTGPRASAGSTAGWVGTGEFPSWWI